MSEIVGKHTFDNGYGASVIDDGYGASEGLLEVAVLHGRSIVYDTPVTSDVIGWLTEAEARKVLDQIAALPPRA